MFTSATNVLNQLTSFPGHSRTSPPKLKCGPSERTTSTRMSLSLAWCTATRKASAKRKSSRLKGGLASTIFPIAPSRSNRIVVIVALLLWPTSSRALIGGLRDDRQQQVRRPLCVPVDPVGDRLAAANVVWDVLDIGHRACAGRNIHGCDIEAYPVPRLELVRRGEDLYPVLDHFSRLHGSSRILRKPVERLPGPGALLIESPVGRFQPAPRQLAFGQRRRNIAFTLARGTNGDVGPYILEHDNPVGVLLIDCREQRQRDWADDGDVVRQGIGHVAQPLDLRRPGHRHLRENVGLARCRSELGGGSWRLGRQSLPMREIVLCPLRLRQRPIRSGPPLVGAHKPVAHRRFVHNPGVLPLQPMVIPADDLVVVLMEWSLQVSRPGKQQLL